MARPRATHRNTQPMQNQHLCAHYEHPSSCACLPHLTPAHAKARQDFDIERLLATLSSLSTHSTWGAGGIRLQGHLKATMSDEDLRHFAREILRAVRIRTPYLDALRVVLGNQAEADRRGHTLEMNIRTDHFATERVMRNIIDQMQKAGITKGRRVELGGGRTQVVQCYQPAHIQVTTMPSRACRMEDFPTEEVPY